MLIIKKSGFSDLVVKCPCNGLTYAMSPVLKGLDSVRVVLNWGSTPRDLDSHLIFDGNHIYWGRKKGVQAWLDVDDTDSYGPETITVDKKKHGSTYLYAVHDFSNKANSDDQMLSASGAMVFVYVGQSLVRTYHVPRGTGNLWTVFRITADGNIEDINRLAGYSLPGHLAGRLISELERADSTTNTANTGTDNIDTASAKRNNTLGEKAYHDGNLEAAIDYYQASIQNDPNFANAYANLGLAYRKLNRFAESIWASRKAISFASGSNAAKTRAGAYYEIAKLYEDNDDFESALRHYKLAKQNNNLPVYDAAIARMNEKLR
jgi:hypothetical protein